MIEQVDIDGDPFIGIMCRSCDRATIVPFGTRKNIISKLRAALGNVDVLKVSIGGSMLLGSLCAMNSRGMLLPDFATDEDVIELAERFEIGRMEHRLNAVGNNILVNDRAGMAHPGYSQRAITLMEDLFGVEMVKGTIAGMRTVGSCAIATNKGVLVHPKVDEDEMRALNDIFKVNIQKGTSNYGSPMLGAAVIANSYGAVTGTLATGIELGRIEDALDLF